MYILNIIADNNLIFTDTHENKWDALTAMVDMVASITGQSVMKVEEAVGEGPQVIIDRGMAMGRLSYDIGMYSAHVNVGLTTYTIQSLEDRSGYWEHSTQWIIKDKVAEILGQTKEVDAQ